MASRDDPLIELQADSNFVATSVEDIAAQSGDPNFMASLARGLVVIQAFSDQRPLMTVSQISQKTRIPRAAVRRCLYTLEKMGFVSSEEGGSFCLRPRILLLGQAYFASTPLSRAAEPVLRRLSKPLNESSAVSILDGDDILYIARASTKRLMAVYLDVGSRLPAIYTAMGRVLLAYLPAEEQEAHLKRAPFYQHTPNSLMTPQAVRAELERIRAQGFAVIDQELEPGVRAMALPIIASDGRAIAAVNVGVQAHRVSIEDMKERILPVLRDAASELALLNSRN